MSDDRSGGMSIGDAIGMAVILFALVLFFIAMAILTFLNSPGMAILAAVKLALGAAWSPRQTWVLAGAVSGVVALALCVMARDVRLGLNAYLGLCALCLGGWVVMTYGFEAKIGEKIAAVYFPEFTVRPAPAAQVAEKAPADPGSKGAPADLLAPMPISDQPAQRAAALNLDDASVTTSMARSKGEPSPEPTPLPAATFRVAMRLPLKRAYVMVRLNDIEVFRADFRPGRQPGTPALLTPPIIAKAGPAEMKVWVISPDKKEADEYVILPVGLQPGEDRLVKLAFDAGRPLKSRLVAVL